ncbi:MAG: CoA-binding protein [Acidobacteria bacterium]|nr:CoA-binding protein [Acidobacteriota bacterium]
MEILIPENLKSEFSADPITDLLKRYRTVAVVGLSSNPDRASNHVGEYIKSARYRMIPVNPNEREIFGEKSYADLEGAAAAIAPQKIEIVDIFRRPENIPPIVDSAIATGAKVIWMQLGIENEAAAAKAIAAGLVVVMDACFFVEHKRRRGSL